LWRGGVTEMKNEQGLRELIIAELRPRIPQYYCKDIKLQKIAGAIITVLKPYLALTEQASPQMMSEEDLWNIFAEVKDCKPNQEDCTFKRCHSWAKCSRLIDALANKIPKPQALPQMMSKIDDVMKIQLAEPSTKTDSYMQGLANGMIMIKSIITGDEPKFITIPKPQTEKYICLTCQRKHTDADCPDRNNRIECDKYQPKPQAEADRCGCGGELLKRTIDGVTEYWCERCRKSVKPILGKEKEEEI
jgi:hypothetical protein